MNTNLIAKVLILIPFIWASYVVGSIIGIAIADAAKNKQVKILILVLCGASTVLIATYTFYSMMDFKKPAEPIMHAIPEAPIE